MLRGANDLKAVCEEKIGPKMQVTDDGKLSWEEVECLGACANAPMAQINDYYFEDLTNDSFGDVIDKLRNGVDVEPGPLVDRQKSAPIGGVTSLKSDDLYNGSAARPMVLPNLPEAVEPASEPSQLAPVAAEPIPAAEDDNDVKEDAPPTLAMPSEGADDLKRIKGIGPKNEDALNELGIFTFAQISGWDFSHVKWVERRLQFPGRINREDWIGQAKQLESGEETEFSKRVDAGEVPSSNEEGE